MQNRGEWAGGRVNLKLCRGRVAMAKLVWRVKLVFEAEPGVLSETCTTDQGGPRGQGSRDQGSRPRVGTFGYSLYPAALRQVSHRTSAGGPGRRVKSCSGPRRSVSGSVGGQRRGSRIFPRSNKPRIKVTEFPGYVSRVASLSKSPRPSKEERLRARQEADLAEMEHAHAQLMDSLREMTEDLIAGRRIRRRDPRSARAKRLFRRARG